ncbi:MAG: bifunctional oligoribonuclease/PAP phosphatase NrnA, partial [Clostridia bacterium]|nr:bifunctional oligoribonuclease/PAP phosphatase NrnA [Clostridia bacterium]
MRQTQKIRNNEIVRAIREARSVLLVAHVSPDGDAVGSLLACGRVLMSLGKQVTMALQDPVPEKYRFLPGADAVADVPALTGKRFDLGLALDCADKSRMGECAEAYFACACTAQLDHHATNPGYAMLNEV